jgi:anhydro-N-acetylmuramic acid kinase
VTSTLQLGEPAVIAELTGITCIADFRVADVAAGGQGAPLTSIFDWLILRPTITELNGNWRAVQNIGGIANVTLLPPHGIDAEPLAFDTGPGNVFIDWCATKISQGQQTFDVDGRFASQGHVHAELLHLMESHEYFHLPPPKTTGRELFTFSLIEKWDSIAKEKKISDYDFIATVTELTASTIVNAYKNFSPGSIGQVVVGGGGCRNPYLMERIKVRLKESFNRTIDVCTHEKLSLNSDAKEALVFALLAYLCVNGRPGNIPTCTGAIDKRILGKIIPGKNFTKVLLTKQ